MSCSVNPLDPLGIADRLNLPDPLNIVRTPDAPPPPPPVVREAPMADAVKAEDTSKQDAVKERLVKSRRRRAASLLAQGATGDPSQPLTATPAAVAGKQQLGA